MFAKVDSDGSGSVDSTELQSMLDHVAQKSGQTAGDATQMLSQMDGNGDGSLSQDELGQGMKDLMPPPSDTMAFAQRRGGGGGDSAQDLLSALDTDQSGEVSSSEMQTLIDQLSQTAGSSAGTSSAPSGADLVKALDSDGSGSLSSGELQALKGDSSSSSSATSSTTSASGTPAAQGHHGPHSAGGPPPPRNDGDADDGGSSSSSSSSSSASTDPLDTNGDGKVSMAERLAGAAKAEATTGSAATRSTDGTSSTGENHKQMMDLAAMAADLLQRFSALAGGSSNDASGGGATSSGFSAVA
jgi:Ca2+-binding EF-hand superfamily protein